MSGDQTQVTNIKNVLKMFWRDQIVFLHLHLASE